MKIVRRWRGLALVGAGLAVVGIIGAVVSTRMTAQRADASRMAADPATRGRLEHAIKELDLIRPAPRKLAQDFTVPTKDGRPFRLAEHRGKVVLINFWATWCPPCREEMPTLERLYEQSRREGLVVLAVSVDGDSQSVAPFVNEQRLTFAIGLDPNMTVSTTYGVRGLPASFIIDRDGYLAAVALGPRTWDNAASKALVEGLSR